MSAWGQLDQLLTCAICLDRYKNPKLLPCQHTFCCEPCMEGLVDYGRRQIKCPECRAEHRIPYQGVQTLPTNVTLIRFLDLHRNITGEEEEPPPSIMERCGVCSEKSTVERCCHCEKKICSDCREAHLDIMRREINRINNQVRRGLNRLSDTLAQTQKNGEKLNQNLVQVKEEIEELVRRYVKDLKDTEERLLHELEVYVENETKTIDKLKDDLETEVTNMTSNCDLVDKYIVEDMEWTDVELVEYKEVFLKTLDFLRNFDADPSDFARRIKLQHNSDPEVLHKTLISFGELKTNTPPAPTPAPSTLAAPTSPSFLTPPSNALMRSQSDHRLASQFQRRQQEGPSSTSRSQYLDTGNSRFGGHTSDSERDSFGRNRKDSETGSGYRRYGDRAGLRDYDSSDRESSTRSSRFLRPSDCDYSSSRFRDSNDDLASRFQSRFARELLEDSGHESESHGHSRSVRFEEPSNQSQTPPRERVIDTEDATRGPLSGVIRLSDSAYIMERLHQNEVKQKQDLLEKERKANEPPPPPTPAPPPVTRRAPATRQVSEDEIEKQKKQNQVAAAASSTTPAAVAPSTPSPPAATTPPQSPLPPVPETTPASTKPVPRRLASLKDDETSSGPRNVRQDSRSQDSAESGGSSRGSPFEDAPSSPAEPTPPARTYGWRRSSTDAEAQRQSSTESKRPDSPRQSGTSTPPSRQQMRSPRPPMGKSVSLDVDNREDRRTLGSRTSSIDKKEDPRNKTPIQSTYQSRLQGPRRIAEAEKDEASDSESESEVTSSESESDEAPAPVPKRTEGPTTSSAVNSLLARSAQLRKEIPEPKKDYSTRSTRHSNYAREKEKEDSPKSKSGQRESLTKKEEPVSRYGVGSSRRRTSTVDDEPEETSSYNRYLPRSRSSALVSGLGGSRAGSRDVSPDDVRSSGDRRDSLRNLSALRRNRISRSRSSHEMALNDDSPEDDRSTSSPYRSRFERPSDSLTSSSALARSRSHHALKSRDPSPDESASNSTWAQYLRTKYGSRSGSGSGGNTRSPVSRSKSSGSLYSRSGTDNSSDDETGGHDGRRDSVLSRYGDGHNQYSFSYPRNLYMQKRKMVLRIGCRGTEPGCFTWPRGVAVGLDNSIVVADSSNHRVQVFDSNGKFLQEFGTYGSEEGKFDCLAGVAVNRIGQYIISDRYNHRIQVFDPSGRFLRAFGVEGRTDGRFSYPWGITTDSLGFIYICDKENHRIQVFQSDGTFVGKFGSIGSRSGYLEHPHYIAVSNTNRVIVSDSNNHRIQIFDVNGRSLSTFGTEGSDEGQFKFPRGVAVDDQGYIIVGDSGNNRIQIFHPDGTFLRSFGTWGAGDGEFKGLEGIAVTSTGSILVCDRENHRIQVF